MFQDNLRTIRAAKNLTQEDLAKALFVSQQAVSLWETGRGYPDVPILKSLAKYLGVKVDDLIGVEEFVSAKSEKKMRPAPLWVITLVIGLVLIFLLTVFTVFDVVHYSWEHASILAGILMLIVPSLIVPTLYAIYKNGSSKLLLSGMLSFGALFSCFLGLCIAKFVSAGPGDAASWVWLSCSLVALLGFGLFVYFYFRSKTKACDDKTETVRLESEVPTRHLHNGWAFAAFTLAIVLVVLFSTPWLTAHFGIPVYDSFGNQTIFYFESNFFMAYTLWHSGFFAFLDFLCPLSIIGLLIVSFLALWRKTSPKVSERLANASVILMGVALVIFLISAFFAYLMIPAM